MKKLSIVVVGRDDGYGDSGLAATGIRPVKTFLERLRLTSEYNIIRLLKEIPKEDLQYIIVDWNPINGRYIFESFLKSYLEFPLFKNVIVSNESVIKYGLQDGFYEYYAKNVGLRQSESEYTIITNPDDIFSDDLIQSIISIIAKNNDNEYYRPHNRLDVDENFNVLAEGLNFPENGLFEDYYLGTPASGDFLMAKTKTLIEFGKGYNESNIEHKDFKCPAGMDGELLCNLYAHGILPCKINGSILHLDHAKGYKGGTFSKERYENTDDWGFVNYPVLKVNDNTIII